MGEPNVEPGGMTVYAALVLVANSMVHPSAGPRACPAPVRFPHPAIGRGLPAAWLPILGLVAARLYYPLRTARRPDRRRGVDEAPDAGHEHAAQAPDPTAGSAVIGTGEVGMQAPEKGRCGLSWEGRPTLPRQAPALIC